MCVVVKLINKIDLNSLTKDKITWDKYYTKDTINKNIKDKYQIRNFNHLSQPKIVSTIPF